MSAQSLHKILGVGFGLAIAFGTMVGVGILRLPGTVAAAIGNPTLIMISWCLGGLYALMGAVSVAELAAMYPEAGGFRVYARRAFGEGAGFVIGWIDWLAGVATLAYGAVTVVAFLGTLWPACAPYDRPIGSALLVGFTAMHWAGLRIGSRVTAVFSTTIALLLMILVIACFVATPLATAPATAGTAAAVSGPGHWSAAMLFAIVPALRAIVTAYDGWYAPIYMAEENIHAQRTVPRAIIGCALLVVALYLLINLALLRVLPLPVLAASPLPAAAAATRVLPYGGMELITLTSIFTVLGLINSNALAMPRVLFSMAREGWIPQRVAAVRKGGTPHVALAATMLTGVLMILTGGFNRIIAIFAVLTLCNYVAAFLAVFVLRWRKPDEPRPYRAFGFPITTAMVLVGSLAILIAVIAEDPRSAMIAAIFLAACVPAYAWAARSRRTHIGRATDPAPATH